METKGIPSAVMVPACNPSTQKAKWREFKFEASIVQYPGPFSTTVKKKSVFLGCNLMVENVLSMYKKKSLHFNSFI